MHATVLAVLLFQSIFVSLVQATLYVIEPTAGSTCSGGKPCTVAWLDDGTAPLLAEIGATHVALYNGEHVLVQQIDPVDISVVHAFTFTPDPNAGSNSGNYYINFTSVNLVGNPPAQFSQFSPSFTLDSMTGNLKTPIASDTSDIPVPPSVLSPYSNSVSGTSTIHGTTSTSSVSQASSAASSASTTASSGSTSFTQSSGTPASGATSSTATGATSGDATSASTSQSGSSSQATGSTSGTASSSSSGPAASGAASTGGASSNSTDSASTNTTTSSASVTDDLPTTTLTVAAMTSGFATARTTNTAPLSSDDPLPTDTQSTDGVSGSSTSGGARAVSGIALVPATLSSIALVLSAAFLL